MQILSPIQAIVLGIVQGLTEFLPVSSTSHLVLFPWLFGWPEGGQTFDVALHAGTLIAVVIYFWRDWMEMATRRHRLLGMVIVACIPAGIVGFLFEKKIDYYSNPDTFHLAPVVISTFLIVAGLLLYWVDHRKKNRREIETVDSQDAVLIGIGQAFALFPGVSRSGATISAGLFLGLNREAAARFSFLVSAPVIFGAVALKGLHVAKSGLPPGTATPMALGIFASAVTGYLAIKFLMNYVRTRPYDGFVVYRVALAVVILTLWFVRR